MDGRHIKESAVIRERIDVHKPNFYYSSVNYGLLTDEISWVNLGSSSDLNFYDFKLFKNQISTETNFPKKYKFTSVKLHKNLDRVVLSRQTYDFLEFLGDLGGLKDALHLIGEIMLFPIMNFSMKVHLGSLLYLLNPKKNKKEANGKLQRSLSISRSDGFL